MNYLDCVCNAGARACAGVRVRDAKVYACDACACVGAGVGGLVCVLAGDL